MAVWLSKLLVLHDSYFDRTYSVSDTAIGSSPIPDNHRIDRDQRLRHQMHAVADKMWTIFDFVDPMVFEVQRRY